MALDDPASDADETRSPQSGAELRFTTRTFLSPDDGAPHGEPGDGSAGEVPQESFGTGDIDDAALDAIVEDTDPEPAFVWAADDLAAAEASSSDLTPADPSEFTTFSPDSPAAPEETAPDAADRAAQADDPTAHLELAPEDPFAMVGSDLGGTSESAEAPIQAPLGVGGAAGAEPEAPGPGEPESDEMDAGGLGSVLTAAGAGVLGALADVVDPDEPPADDPANAGAPDPDAGTPDAETSEAGAAEPPAQGAPGDTASLDSVPHHPAETTADVDDAFESETDADKADAPGPDGIEGDLEVTPLGPDDFEPDELRAVLRTMMTSRRLDEKMLTLLKQGKGFFHIGSAGHEASQIAVASQFEGGRDWFCFYYRDLGTALQVGVTPAEVLRAHFGKASDPFGGGRQMPEHFGHRALNILSTSSSVGAQYVPAVGFGLAIEKDRARDGDTGPTKAVYTSGGEGSTSQGAFHEALNWAAREALPVLFHIQDNKYAISVPVEEQTAGGSIWHLLGGYAGLRRIRYDGTDYFESLAAARAAMEHIRAGHGPVALHADLVRLFPHSSSDDHRKYRETASIEADAARDPLAKLVRQLTEAGVVTEDEVEAMRAEIAAEIDRTAREVEAEPDPDPATATAHVYYEGDDERDYEADGEAGELVVMVDAINHALDEEMARDPRVLVYGEDVGGGKGGVFTATRGLTEKHGRDRCFNSPLAEHSVIGSAVGLAAAGYKPVVEIQFADYIWPGMQPLRNQVASMRYRSNGEWANPMVIRVPCGGYIHGGLCHSQNVEALFGHFPGLQVVLPSNAADAKGLLKTAIRGEDPVIFLEHKALYRQGPARRPEPHADYLVPFGKAAIAREGTDLTIVTWGAIVYKALNVAKTLEREGVSVEVVDVRSILPFDTETVLASARKTGRVLVAYEDHEFMGFGAEVAAQIADGAFGHLDGPVKRVAGAFSSIPYADPLERAVLPQDDDVLAAAREVLAY